MTAAVKRTWTAARCCLPFPLAAAACLAPGLALSPHLPSSLTFCNLDSRPCSCFSKAGSAGSRSQAGTVPFILFRPCPAPCLPRFSHAQGQSGVTGAGERECPGASRGKHKSGEVEQMERGCWRERVRLSSQCQRVEG